MSPQDANKALLREAFQEVMVNPDADETIIAKYMSKDYRQNVDGLSFDYEGFVQHMVTQKQVIKEASVEFEHMVAEGDKVCTVHHIHAVKDDGNEIKGKVVALFQFKDNKIILCDELTHLVEGSEEDRDLGSRT